MKVTLEFYGRLKDQFSPTPLDVEIKNHASTIESVYLWMCEKHSIEPEVESIKPILNDTFANWDDVVSANDAVGFFPPASGG